MDGCFFDLDTHFTIKLYIVIADVRQFGEKRRERPIPAVHINS